MQSAQAGLGFGGVSDGWAWLQAPGGRIALVDKDGVRYDWHASEGKPESTSDWMPTVVYHFNCTADLELAHADGSACDGGGDCTRQKHFHACRAIDCSERAPGGEA